MYQHRLAYRFLTPQGEGIEGFVGSGFTTEAARKDALRKVAFKLSALSDVFGVRYYLEDGKVIEADKGLTPTEAQKVREDWKVSERSSFC